MDRRRTALAAALTALAGLGAGAVAQEPLSLTVTFQPESGAETQAEAKHDEKATKIIDAYIEKIGGKELIGSIESTRMKGEVSIPMAGITGTIEVANKAPGRMSMVMDLAGFGKTEQGYDGEIGWSSDAMQGPRLLTEEEVADVADQADPAIALKYRDLYPTIEHAGEVDFNGQKAHKIRLVRENGRESFEYYSVESGLMVGQESIQASPMGEIKIVTHMDDYKEFGGMKVPTSMTQNIGPTQIIITINSMEMNNVDDAAFERPEAVKALVEAKKD